MNLEFVTSRTMLRGTVGSQAHGLSLPGNSDRDEMGIFVETKAQVMGLDTVETFTYRDAKDGERSKPGDLELTFYSLRKFVRLARQGNPTVMELLYLPSYSEMCDAGLKLLDNRHLFWSQESGQRYLGYLIAQKQKMKGERAHTVKRTDLLEKFGYDTKFAMHALRLAIQGKHFVSGQGITLPCVEEERKLLMDVRQGKYTETEFLEMLEDAESDLRLAIPLAPTKLDNMGINNLLVCLHEKYWNAERT